MVKVEKDNGIYAEVIKHSSTEHGKEIATVAVKYGLIVHSELLRHRMLSRGVKSNRAIPTKVIRQEVLNDPYVPVFLGLNKPGMVSTQEIKWKRIGKAIFLSVRYPVVFAHWLLEKLGAHKEWTNRLLNPWQWVRETITFTEANNMYALRMHPAAQRDAQYVVECIKEAVDKSRECGNVDVLSNSEWHTPYVTSFRDTNGEFVYMDNDGSYLTPAEASVCSAARCARSSYDKHDGGKATLEDDVKLFSSLMDDNPKHASPVEHQASPMSKPTVAMHTTVKNALAEDGVTHVDKEGKLWSGNFMGWIQHRQLIPQHDIKG